MYIVENTSCADNQTENNKYSRMAAKQHFIGGKLLDTGTYSCIFDPPLKCRTRSKTPKKSDAIPGTKLDKAVRMISKLMMDEEAEVEWTISEIIRKIPEWIRYFSVAETMCELSPQQTETELKTKCQVIKYISTKQLRVLQMPYAGTPIYNHPISRNFNLTDFVIHILEASALLLVYNIIHFDLHPGNILLDEHDTPRIIDFNLSMSSNISVPESQLSYRYSRNFHLPQQPPDYTAVIGINQHKDILKIIRNIKDKDIIRDIRTVLSLTDSTIESDIRKMIQNNSFIGNGDITGWFHKYWSKIDSWAIGTYLVDMIKNHAVSPQIGKAYTADSGKLKHIIKSLCAIDPDTRWDCMQALEHIHPNSHIIKKYMGAWSSSYKTAAK
jgi:serine/threonine protein kinase